MAFPFADDPDIACIVCRHVLDKEKKITYVSHDADDGMWQFLCGESHTEEDAKLVSLCSVYRMDEMVGQIADMPCGCFIERENGDVNWGKE